MPRTRIYHAHRLRTGRRSERGRVYLTTTVTRDRTRTFADWNKGCACARVLHQIPGRIPVESLAWVVMPDHVHWMFSLEDQTLGDVMRQFKTYAARAVNGVSGDTGSIWQAGFHDHAVRYEEDLRDLARYIVANPVRAGLCDRVGDYPFWNAVWLANSDPFDVPDDLLL